MIKIKNITGFILASVLLLLLFEPLPMGFYGFNNKSENITGTDLSEHIRPDLDSTDVILSPMEESTVTFGQSPEATILELTFPFTQPLIKRNKEKEYLEIILNQDIHYTNQGGYPQIPYRVDSLIFPLGTRILDLQVTPSEIQTIPLSNQIKSSPYPTILSTLFSRSESKPSMYLSLNESLSNAQSYPSQWGTYTLGGGIHNNQHVTILSIYTYPCRYFPMHSFLKYTSRITVQLTYETPQTVLPTKGIYDCLVIAPPLYQDELQPLVTHKNSYGIQTKLVTTTDIYNGTYFSTQGRDSPEKIKYFLKNAVENWGITHVLLVGNIESLPSREVYSFWWGDHPMYSDHYYADIYDSNKEFCSWDSNNNNRFGELDPEKESISNDAVDLYADLYLGRLACGNPGEVTTVVNKIIAYETTSYGKDWFQRLILMGGDTFPSWNDVMEGELVNEYVAEAMPDFIPVKIQMSENNFLPHRINQILSNGAGFVCYSGHGFEYGFGTYPKDNRWMIAYYTPYLLGLKNEDKLPIIFFDACLTAKLDYYLLGNPDIPCFAWAMVKKPNGGAIATIGATETATTTVDENGPWGQAGYLDLHFFRAYKPGISLGEMLVQAQNDYLEDIDQGVANDRFYEMTIEQFILLGDPTLRPGGYP